jgi:diguanylate cyclase (GGDEF)-like protein
MVRLKRDYEGILRPKWGQISLAVLLLACIAALAFVSINSMQAQNVERQQIFSEESDASAMIFVQRESFNTLVAFHEWADGWSTARDVQIDRALLGQRLNVITSSGVTTYDLTAPSYREILGKVDKVIRGMSSVPDDQRAAYNLANRSLLADFRSAAIQLDSDFQRFSRAQMLQVVDARAASELQQAFVLGLILLLGLGLSGWLAFDIITNYRKTSRKLKEQRKTLESAKQSLELLHSLDQLSGKWLEQINTGAATQSVLAQIKENLRRVMPGLSIDFISNHEGDLILVTPDSEGQPDDWQLAISRVQEALQVMATRDSHLRQLDRQRDYDQLTQLPNRDSFSRSIEAAVRVGSKGQRWVGLMLVDVDRFRDVNASLGYGVGDELLVQVARRLELLAQGGEQVSRLSADEFGVLISGKNRREVEKRARFFAKELAFGTSLAGNQAQISVSSGLAILAPDETSRGDLSRWAAMAIYLSKAPGDRSQFVVYEPDQHQALLNNWYEELAVRKALRSGEFKVFYQPIVGLGDGVLVGVEALVRWDRPGFGLVSPGEFLPTVQRAGITVELGWQILEIALSAWRNTFSRFDEQGQSVYLSVNVDAAQLADPNFAEFVVAAIQRNQVDARSLVLEVTEGTLVQDSLALEQIRQLNEYGIRIALDDFGTGFNNLGQIHNLPVDVVKIDRSFIGVDSVSPKNLALITDILAIAKTIDASLVVEGVETDAVADQLRDLGVPMAQGFLHAKAMPEDQLESWAVARRVLS